tara:strand:- start:309 stop:515 length:207 start_codon:yes stop_codon:yes gene_type:complete
LAKSEHDFGCVGLESRGELTALSDGERGEAVGNLFTRSESPEVSGALSPPLGSLKQQNKGVHKAIKFS